MHFDGITTILAGERRYRQLAKRLHPDNLRTGDAAAFVAMQEEWQVLKQVIARHGEIPKPRKPRKPRKPNPPTEGRKKGRVETPVPPVTPGATEPSDSREQRMREAVHTICLEGADLLLSSWLGTRGR